MAPGGSFVPGGGGNQSVRDADINVKLSPCLIKHHVMKTYKGVEV
jgi:hypothetical protein